MTEPGSSDLKTTTKSSVICRCKKCRRIVASEENIVSHQHGKSDSSFKWKKRSGNPWGKEKQQIECTSLFVEPMKWMQAVQEGSVEINFSVWAVMLVWVTSTGQVCSAVVEPGLTRHFSFIKAD